MSKIEFSHDIVIVGAGHGGAQVAMTLRQSGFSGSIALIGDEPGLPYERPPLSKDYLSGERPAERLMMRPRQFWLDRTIDMFTGHRVTLVDPIRHRVSAKDGATFSYSNLVWATGGTPRRLTCPGHELEGIYSIRNREDVDRIRANIEATRRIIIAGGGYIGLEAAAVLSKMEKQVVLVEALDRVLARVAGEPLSRFYEAEHRRHGVDIRLNATIDRIEGRDRVARVRLASGEELPCDMLIVGIGIVPSVGPLLDAGASGGNGVEVDSECRTTLPNVFAIGDCALHTNRYADGARIRLESVQNATDQAKVVAQTIIGAPSHYDEVPWFWSTQYDLRLQTVGLSMGYDAVVLRGNPAEHSFTLCYLKKGRVVAFDCVNATRDYVQGKRLVAERLRVSPATLANTSISLKDLCP